MRYLAFLLSLATTFSATARDEDMVRVPAGPFTMGSDDGPAEERPAHTVTLRAFEIQRLPVTNAEFAHFLDRHGPTDASGRRYYDGDDSDARIHPAGGEWRADPGFEDHPVVEASWLGAQAYCRALGKRLPTEAEWEKAARGTDARRYPWGHAAPTVVPAPGLYSTTTGCFQSSENACARMRACTSEDPPGGNGITSRTILFG